MLGSSWTTASCLEVSCKAGWRADAATGHSDRSVLGFPTTALRARSAAPSAGLQHVFGEPGTDVIVTMHVVLRPPLPAKAPGECPRVCWADSASCSSC